MTLTTPQWIALLPLLITSGTATLVMLSIAVRRHHAFNATVTVAGLNLALASVGYAAWRSYDFGPQGITPLLIVDNYAYLYMAMIIGATLACATLAHAYMEGFAGNREELYLLLTLACTGGIVLVCSRHLAGLFIGLELLSVPVYGMVAYTFRQSRSLESGIKYMVLSAAASAFLLFGMALLYAQAGSLSFAGVGAALTGEAVRSPLVLAGVALMLTGLGFKLSLAPFHLWTPDVYEGAPAPVGAFLATASKVAVFAALLRFFYVSPAAREGLLFDVLTVIAIVSIAIGNLLALTQTNLKRLLGYSSIAHFGYILVAIVAHAPLSVEAVGVYLVTYQATTLGAFGVVALMSSPYQGQDADAIFDYRGLFWRRPYLTAVLTVMMLSLAGIPMTAGFIGKFYIVTVGVAAKLWWLLGAVVLGSAIGLYYYLRVMVTLYLPAPGMRRYDAPLHWGQQAGGYMVILLIGAVLLIGIFPQPALELVNRATIALQ
jgi:NADH-quinone oxidoreductase subunit N